LSSNILKEDKKFMCNTDVRTKAKAKKVTLWQIAEALGISEPTMSRRMRHEMTADEKKRIFTVIDEISAVKNASR